MNDFQEILRELPKRNILLVCGDINFPNTNWDSWTTFDEEEAELIELFESRLLKQSINFPTCNSNTLDVFFYQNCTVFSENDQKFDKTFNCSDHLAIMLSTLTTLTGCPTYTFPQEQVTDKLCLPGFNRAPRTNWKNLKHRNDYYLHARQATENLMFANSKTWSLNSANKIELTTKTNYWDPGQLTGSSST